jgi:glucose-1-phosphate thymidylyltransferase
MNILVLCAGYATRLYPLTLDKPKPLLPIAGKPMLEWLLHSLAPIPDVKKVVIVTNHKFAPVFARWVEDSAGKGNSFAIEVVDDGTVSDQDKLGAIGDIHLAMGQAGLYEDDLLIVAGDNLFGEAQTSFADFVKDKAAAVGIHDVGSLEEIRKYGNVEVDAEGKVVSFVEKPTDPKSTLAAIALYYYKKENLPLIDRYLEEGNNPDQPGRLVAWLYQRIPVHAFPIQGLWFDIGSKESLVEADEVFTSLLQQS